MQLTSRRLPLSAFQHRGAAAHDSFPRIGSHSHPRSRKFSIYSAFGPRCDPRPLPESRSSPVSLCSNVGSRIGICCSVLIRSRSCYCSRPLRRSCQFCSFGPHSRSKFSCGFRSLSGFRLHSATCPAVEGVGRVDPPWLPFVQPQFLTVPRLLLLMFAQRLNVFDLQRRTKSFF